MMANIKRLIDAGEKKIIIQALKMHHDSQFTPGVYEHSVFGKAALLPESTVDAVEVVRCRDCAKLGLFTCPICFIENKTLQFINHSPDFYCGEGERKDGDGNG